MLLVCVYTIKRRKHRALFVDRASMALSWLMTLCHGIFYSVRDFIWYQCCQYINSYKYVGPISALQQQQ